MKHIIKIFIATLITISCKQEQKMVDYIILNGQLISSTESPIIIRNNYFEPIDTLVVQNQLFVDTLKLNKGYYFFIFNDKSAKLYLEPSYMLNITIDEKDFYNSIKYSGNGSTENNYLAEKDRLRNTFPINQRSYNAYATLEERDFLKQSDSIHQAYLQLFEKHNDLGNDFIFLESKSIEIENALRLQEFQGQKQLVENNPAYRVSEQYPNPFEGIDLNNPKFLTTYKYKTLVHSYFNEKAMDIVNKDNNADFFITYLQLLANSELDPKIKDLLGLDNAEYGFTYTKDLEKYHSTYTDYATIIEYVVKFNEQYHLKKSEKGQQAIGFEFEGIDGKIYKLSDFRGKYIYIDIWASWCAPCIKQIPFLKSLEKKYSDKVNFVSIAWKDNASQWKKAIEKESLEGIQLFAPNKDAEFFKFFGVTSIPRFILLDREGKIIESNAKQPSEKSLENQLNTLE